FDAVVEADANPGPKVTFYVPTEVTTTAGGHAAATLTAQLKTAQKGLEEAGLSRADAEAALAEARELTTDSPYWRRQSRGLVVFAAPDFHRAVRLPIPVAESVTVADRFHVRPLVPVLESAGRAYVLAVSKRSVRLFETTRNAIERLPQGRIPESFEDVVDELPEAQVRRSTGMAALTTRTRCSRRSSCERWVRRSPGSWGRRARSRWSWPPWRSTCRSSATCAPTPSSTTRPSPAIRTTRIRTSCGPPPGDCCARGRRSRRRRRRSGRRPRPTTAAGRSIWRRSRPRRWRAGSRPSTCRAIRSGSVRRTHPRGRTRRSSTPSVPAAPCARGASGSGPRTRWRSSGTDPAGPPATASEPRHAGWAFDTPRSSL